MRSLRSGAALLAFAFFTTAFVRVESAETPDYGEQFGKIITRAAIRLQGASPQRPFKLKFMNDSLMHTARATLGMANHWPPEEIAKELSEARRAYPENSFALLLAGILANATGAEQKANRFFEDFLLNSRTFSEFEEQFLKWGEFHTLRRIVYEILKSRGIHFEGREEEIRVRIPYEDLIAYAMRPGTWDRTVNILFIFILVGGGVALVVAHMKGVEFHRLVPGGLVGLYLGVWISYGTWIFDLAFGLPWGWSRFVVIPLFLGCLLLLFAIGVGLEIYEERLRPLEHGYQRCPHCRAVIEGLLIECPECRQGIQK